MDQFVVSARKYRPDTFESVVGQQAITTTLKNAIRSGHIAQSFLFCGPRGVGKTTCARILAKTINCTNPSPEMEACGECDSCKGFQRNASQNIYELDAASNRSVEAMRTLIEQVRIPPQIGKYKVYIIDEVHMLTTEAFNAFLKTLEEPPTYAKFILATTEKNKVLPTILSRCQISDFKRINAEDIVKHLLSIAQKENVQTEEEALRIIAQKADGGLRDALSMFDQMVSFSNSNITYAQVISLLNVLDYDYYFKFTEFFLSGQHSQILSLFNNLVAQGFDAQNFTNGLNQHFRQLLIAKDSQTLPLLELSQNLQNRYGEQSLNCKPSHLLEAMNLCARCDLDYRASNNKRLLVEILLLQICKLFGADPVFHKVVSTETDVEKNSSLETTDKNPSLTKTTASDTSDKENTPASVSTTDTVAAKSAPAVATATGAATAAPIRPDTKESTPKAIPSSKPVLGCKHSALSMKSIKHIISEQNSNSEEDDALEQITENRLEETEKLTDFTALSAIFNKFIQSVKTTSPSLHAILSHTEIEEKDNTVLLRVGNNHQVLSLEEHKQDVGRFLRKELNCKSLTINIIADENVKTEVIVYTAQEKYKKLCSANPNLQTFKSALNLDIEL